MFYKCTHNERTIAFYNKIAIKNPLKYQNKPLLIGYTYI